MTARSATGLGCAAARGEEDRHTFAIGFDPRDRSRLHAFWDEVLDSSCPYATQLGSIKPHG
jgi:hypothetical protein